MMGFVAKIRRVFSLGPIARVSGRVERSDVRDPRRVALLEGSAERERHDVGPRLGTRGARWRLLC